MIWHMIAGAGILLVGIVVGAAISENKTPSPAPSWCEAQAEKMRQYNQADVEATEQAVANVHKLLKPRKNADD